MIRPEYSDRASRNRNKLLPTNLSRYPHQLVLHSSTVVGIRTCYKAPFNFEDLQA